MSLLNFFKHPHKIKGIIGYFDLAEWWRTEFTESERQYIKNNYNSPWVSGESLDETDITYTSESIISFLSGLAGFFTKQEDIIIGYRILSKAEEIIDENSNIIDNHFLYQTKVKIYYRNRDRDPKALDRAIEACNQQIDIGPRAIKAFREELGEELGNTLPTHKGFEQLAIIKEKQKNYSEAIDICKKALQQGWSGDWEKRIERCLKKSHK